jgi:hypothetical protein
MSAQHFAATETILDNDVFLLQRVVTSCQENVPVPSGDNGKGYFIVQSPTEGGALAADREFPPFPGSSGSDAQHGIYRILLKDDALRKMTATNNTTPGTLSTPPVSHDIPDGINGNVGTKTLLTDGIVSIHEFLVQPGDRCPFHRHKYPYMFYNLTRSETRELDADGNITAKNAVANSIQSKGDTAFITREMGLGSHALRNVGMTTFQQFIVEFNCL